MKPLTKVHLLGKVLKNRRFWRGPFPYILLFLVIINTVVWVWQKALERKWKENLLTTAIEAQPSDKPIRWDQSCGENLEKYLPLIPDVTQKPLAIVAGMSQMYAINDAQPGDQIIVEHLDELLFPEGLRAFGLAAPNMHNEEALLLLLATLDNPKTKPAFFIYGVCFDKFRNIDLRPSFQRYLAQTPALAGRWKEAAIRHRNQFPRAADKMLSTLTSASATPSKKNATFEERLRDQAGRYIPIVAARKTLNAIVNMQVFMLRNRVFHITPNSKRPILGNRYEINQEFLGLLACLAKEEGVQPIFYIIPLNPQADHPYIPEQYEKFKSWVDVLCENSHIPFANFEGVVPPQYWGEVMDGPDFKHFRGKGHELTARAIYTKFGPILLNKQAVK